MPVTLFHVVSILTSDFQPNRKNKVLGNLPDLGEELALRRLHAMGMDIGKVYPPGAQVNIASDGVLFNGEYTDTFLPITHSCVNRHSWDL